MNRCDYLDPGLTWTGVKDTGPRRGLSNSASRRSTQPKSYHLAAALTARMQRTHPMSPTANWNYPTAIRFGAGRINELAEACESGRHQGARSS